jgi:hypothetical protein
MSDFDESFAEYKPSHGISTHPWDITYEDDFEHETFFVYTGSEKGCLDEMKRIVEMNWTGDGDYPFIYANCSYENCGARLYLEPKIT